jgi:hypothetical protein
MSPVGAPAAGVYRATLRDQRVVVLTVLTYAAAEVFCRVVALTKRRAADAAVALLTVEAVTGNSAHAVCRDAFITIRRRGADPPVLTAFAVAARVDRAALAAADFRSFALVAATLAIDTFLVWIAAAVVRFLLLLFLRTANLPTACCTTNWMFQIWHSIQLDLDEAVSAAGFTTHPIATLLLARAAIAAGLV